MPAKFGKRVAVLGSTASRTQQSRRRALGQRQRVGKYRLVIFKDGEFVRDRASRGRLASPGGVVPEAGS